MKKTGMKRFLISLLTITVISLLTVGGFLLHASADEAEFANAVASVTNGGITSYYEDFNSAVTVWKNGGTLKLLKNASYSGILNIRPMYGFTASDYVLDLNGKTLNLESIQVGKNGSPNALRVGPTLTLEDSGEGGTVNITGCNMIDYGGLMVLRGGTITGGNGTWGACFLLHIYGSLDMYDGVTLTGSTSNNFAGGVFVGSDSEFNMYGGLITGNSATNYGGGVVLSDNDGAVFNLYGGTISGNTAAKGNGVAVLTGSFNINGNAVLTDGVYLASNKKINIGTTLSETPIGVTLQNGTGVFTSGWSTYMTDGEGKVADPADYFTSDNGNYVVKLEDSEAKLGFEHEHDDIIFSKWTSTNSLPTSGNYCLVSDVTVSSTTTITGTLNLCLCGHGIRMNGTSRIFYVSGGAFGLYDCDTTTTHKYNISAPAQGAGLATVNDALTENYETFTGGYVTGANTSQWGAAVCIENGGLFTLNGGTIIGNTMSGSMGGGGVALKGYSGDRFVMNGGAIIGNTITNGWGGGIYIHEGASFTMNGGVIKENYASKSGNGCGGGISIEGGSSSFILTGGQIINNVAQNHGGNVNLAANTIQISGNVVISGGKLTSGASDNVFINGSRKLNVVGALDDETSIGITLQIGTGVFTSGWSTYMTDGEGKVADPAEYFASDAGNEIVLIGNEVNVHQHNYGSLIEQVDSTCEADGLKAHYYCAGCGQYLDENQAKVSYDELVIESGHTFVRRSRVEPTCTEYGKREHFYCTTCEKYFNTNKQQVSEWSLSIGTLGHDYDFDNAVFTWTPDDSAYYKWTATVSYSCKRCGEQVEKSAGIEGKSATWNQDNGIRAYVYYNSKYYYSEPIYRDSDAGTATMNSWTPWEYDDRLPDAKPEDANSKGWYLTKDVTLTDTWTVPKTSYPYLTLCLNGHVITGNFDTPKSVIYVPKGVEFELCEYNFDETHYYYIGKTVTDSHGNELNFVGQIASGEDDPNYIAAVRKGSFKGGYVTGGSGRSIGGNTYGGAVYIDGDTSTKYYNCGEFESTGVTFFGNYADYGGAVYVASNAYFNLRSGNIIGNQAGNEGGGVYANKRAYSDSQYGNYGMQSTSGQIIHNTAGQGGNGYGGGIAGWSYLPYGSNVRGNAAVGENAKGGGVYGFLKIMDSYIYENYTTGLGPGVYVTNYNFTVDNSTSHIRVYSNQYASSVSVNEIELTSRRGDLYFASGYTLQLIGTTYPPSITDGVRAYVEMASGTGNFATNWKSSYKVYEFFAANPGYKIVENGSTLSLQSSNGDYYVNTAQSFVAYTTYYYANGTPASYNTDETHRYVFSGTRSVSTTFGISGYLKGDNSIYLRFDNLKLTASGTNSLFQFYPYYGNLDVYIELVGDSVLTTNGKSAIYGGKQGMNLNVYFTGSGTLTVVDTVAGTANNLFGPYNDYNTHIYLGGEDITVYELVKEKIANIGFVTYSQEIKERITAARNGYDNLDDELKAKVTNYPDLLAAEAAYELAAAAEINLTATGYTGDYDGEAHGATITVISPEGTTVKYGTKSGEYTLDESPTFTDAGTYKIYYQVTKEKCNTVSDYVTVKINKINATVTIVGNNSTVDYDSTEHTVTGYVATADTTVYDVTKDFTFSGNATASLTNAGTANMGLAAEQFANNNTNFETVTFVVTDGYQTINKINATVTIVGNNSTVDYDSTEHTVTGYVATADTTLYDVTKDFTFSGNATASQTNAGTANMGLTAEQFTNNNANFETVTFVVTDGYQTVNKINATVTIVGNNDTVDYDGTEHTVTDYVATADTALYDVTKDFDFSGSATASQTNAGTANMGLAAEQFTNNNANFATVTFVVTDGYQTVNKINATVEVIGRNDSLDFDGKTHTVKGYTMTVDTDLYDLSRDVVFSGREILTRVSAGKEYMGLAPETFSNINQNFDVVTFNVTDGYIIIIPIDAIIITAPAPNDFVVDGTEQNLVSEGIAEGGIVKYALGADENNAPDDESYAETIPTATKAGTYYVWYKVKSDTDHNDIDPKCLKIVVSENENVSLHGIVYLSDGVTPVENVSIKLMQGDRTVDSVMTDSNGKYRINASSGVYNIVAAYGEIVNTTLVTILEKTEKNIVLPEGNTESRIEVDSDGDFGITVGGLDEEAYYIRKTENVPADTGVSVVMNVEVKAEETAENAAAIVAFDGSKSYEFIDIKIEKTVGTVTTVLDKTSSVLEIAIPFAKASKGGITVYSYHGDGVKTFTESNSKSDGTYFVDKEAGIVYIYSSCFSTYAIGYTPYYRVDASLSFGAYSGTVTATLEGNGETFNLENVSMSNIVFEDVPKGKYTLTITWEDVVSNTLSMSVTVGDDMKSESTVDAGDDVAALPEENSSTVNLSESKMINYNGTAQTDVIYDVIYGVDINEEKFAVLPEENRKSKELTAIPRRRDVFLI